MGVTERRARERDELRRKILGAASELFINEGPANVSLRRIADKIEYAPSTIYLYFKDKSEIISSICGDTFEELERRLAEVTSLGLPPLEGFIRGCSVYIEFGLEHPSEYMFTFGTPDTAAIPHMDNQDYTECHVLAMQAFQHLRGAVTHCMDAGIFQKDDVETVSQSVWLMIHGLASGIIACGSTFPFVDRKALIRTAMDTIVRGLRA